MTSNLSHLTQWFPWVQLPFVANAPMSGVATHRLATAVTLKGSLGFIGFTGLPNIMDIELQKASQILDNSDASSQSPGILPLGVGIITISSGPRAWKPVFKKHKPAVVWLSFGTADRFAEWTEAIREASPLTKVWIQLGSVSAVLKAAKACQPDALVMQGGDAGGYGHRNGASIMTLVPEVADALQEHGFPDIPLLAAGGIMDGRGVAAALALGADGVVMGTRFLGAEECELEADVRGEVFAAADGGQSTVRSRVWDEIWGTSPWPKIYDGRCLRNAMSDDYGSGMDIAEVQSRFYQRIQAAQVGKVRSREASTIWAGSGVGMVKTLEKAGTILDDVRAQTEVRLDMAKTQLKQS